jgi:hypothetical protein
MTCSQYDPEKVPLRQGPGTFIYLKEFYSRFRKSLLELGL